MLTGRAIKSVENILRAWYHWPFAPMTHQLHTVQEAAALLRVSKRTLERLIAAREFPAPVKVGARSLVPACDVVTFIERQIQRRAAT